MSGIFIDKKLEFRRDGLLGYRLRNNSGGSIAAGSVVVFDTTVQAGDAVTTTTTADDPKVAGVMMDTVANGEYGFVAMMGHIDTLKANGVTDIAVGDYLTTHTVAGIAAKQTSAPKGGVFAIALEAYSTNDSNGVIDAMLMPAGRTDASGNTLSYGTAGQMAADGVGSANAAGVTNAVSRVDHVHTNTADTPALTLGTSNSAGTAGSVLAADATIAAFDATAPTTMAPDATAATGSAGTAGRRDHTHGIPTAAPGATGSLVAAGSAAKGTSTSFARADHAHPLLILDDVDVTFGTDSDIVLGHSSANTTSNVDDLVLGVGNTNRALHIVEKADANTDFALAADTNPSVYIHNATTPVTDYLKFAHNASNALLTSVGGGIVTNIPTGETYSLQINSAEEFGMTATALKIASANFIQFLGNNGITDSNSNELLEFTATALATEGFKLVNGTATTAPTFGPNGTGVTANKGFKLVDSNGNESVELISTAAATNGIRLVNNSTGLKPIIANEGGEDVGLTLANFDGANTEEILILAQTASAVNEVTITNAATGNRVSIAATGDDANIGISLTPKGTGVLVVDSDVTASGRGAVLRGTDDVALRCDDNNNGTTNMIQFLTDVSTELARIEDEGNIKLGGTANPATTVGTKAFLMYTGTAPVGTIASGGALYVATATNVELVYLDSAGNVQQLSTT